MLVLIATLFVARAAIEIACPALSGDRYRVVAVFAMITAGVLGGTITKVLRKQVTADQPLRKVHTIVFGGNVRPSTTSLVPPLLSAFEIRRAYLPVREFRGDFFLAKRLRASDNRSVLLVIGDVSGEGSRTSLAVSRLIFAIDELADESTGPAHLLEKLNRIMQGRLNGEIATCMAVHIQNTGACSFSSAGHPFPLLNGREVPSDAGLPLGLVRDSLYTQTAITIEVSDCLALYTNGMTEARNSDGDLFGHERLRKMFSDRLSPSEIAAHVKNLGIPMI